MKPSPRTLAIASAALLSLGGVVYGFVNEAISLALEAATPYVEQGFEVRCDLHLFDKVSHALEKAGIKTESAEIAYIPTTTVPVSPAVAASIEKLHDSLDEHDDVQHVFSNEDAPL